MSPRQLCSAQIACSHTRASSQSGHGTSWVGRLSVAGGYSYNKPESSQCCWPGIVCCSLMGNTFSPPIHTPWSTCSQPLQAALAPKSSAFPVSQLAFLPCRPSYFGKAETGRRAEATRAGASGLWSSGPLKPSQNEATPPPLRAKKAE